jgi:outer membrane receptor protein involved in Fe transport
MTSLLPAPRHDWKSIRAVPAACALAGSIALAATAPTAPSATSAPTGELVELTPFEVRSTPTGGYASSESASGTRYAALIREIPFPVNVISSEFMQDTVAETLDDVLAYTSSFTSSDGESFLLRGMAGTDAYKNGIRGGGNSSGTFATTAVERVEVVKGSSASIYGATSPTGLINVVTKRAHAKPAQRLALDLGNLDYYRTALDVNQPLVRDRLALRLALSTLNNETANTDYWRKREDVFYGTLGWTVSPRTVLHFNTEWIKRKNWGETRRLPFVTDLFTLNGQSVRQFSGHFGVGPYKNFLRFNPSGPEQVSTVESRQFDMNASHTFGDHITFRVNVGHWQRFTPRVNTTQGYNGSNTATSYDESVDRLLGNAFEIRAIRRREFRTVAQADVLARFQTAGVKHQFLLNADFNKYNEGIINRGTNRADSRLVTPDSILKGTVVASPTFPYGAPITDLAVWDRLAQNTKSRSETKGFMANDRAALLGNRLFLNLGMRHDEVNTENLNYLDARPAWTAPRIVKADTVQSGAVYTFIPALSAYASYSESFTPNNPDLKDRNLQVLPNLEGKGREFGLKGELFDKRLGFTVGYYHIVKSNVPRTALDQDGNRLTVGTPPVEYSTVAEITSKGYELDWNWRVSDAFEILGGVGWNDSHYSAVPNPTEQWLLQQKPDTSAKWTAALNAVGKVPAGRLKGLSGRIGLRYEGERALTSESQVSTVGTSNMKGAPLVVGGQTFERRLFATEPLWLFDAALAYRWTTHDKRYGHAARITTKNLFDKIYVRSRRAGDPRSIIFSYEITH